jgi:membrane associated rhomboid family serine protease
VNEYNIQSTFWVILGGKEFALYSGIYGSQFKLMSSCLIYSENSLVRFEVFRPMKMSMLFLWVIMLCGLISGKH